MQFTKDEKYNILKKICPNTTECITFGTQSDQIRELFDEFKIPSPLIDEKETKQIGKASNNGVIYRLKYQLKDYNAYTIIKNALDEQADNLYYEAVVGWYINTKMRYYPCFVETYDLYKNNNDRDPKTNLINDFNLNKLTALFPESTTELKPKTFKEVDTDFYKKITEAKKLIETCKESDTISLNIQYLDNVTTLFDILLIEIPQRKPKYVYDMYTYLYQVYAPLGMLSDEFTHYDLHVNNVLIYKIDPNKYTKMIYHYPDNTTVEFNTVGIAKIIDYGRCYFKYNDAINSKNFIDTLEKNMNSSPKNSTKPNNPDECGYVSFSQEFQKYYIDSRTHNKSHDLRLISNVNHIYKQYINQVLFNIEYKEQYGTPEVSENRYTKKGDRIHNVNEMHEELRQMLISEKMQTHSKALEQSKSLYGTIECWLDKSKQMTFTPGPVDIPEKSIFQRMIRRNHSKPHAKILVPKSLQNLVKTPRLPKNLYKQIKSVGGKPIRKTKRNKKNNDKRKTYKTKL